MLRKLPQPLEPFTRQPKCFDTRTQWIEWQAFEQSSRRGDREPIRFGPCTDCTKRYQAKMIEANRCERPWLDLAWVALRKDAN